MDHSSILNWSKNRESESEEEEEENFITPEPSFEDLKQDESPVDTAIFKHPYTPKQSKCGRVAFTMESLQLFVDNKDLQVLNKDRVLPIFNNDFICPVTTSDNGKFSRFYQYMRHWRKYHVSAASVLPCPAFIQLTQSRIEMRSTRDRIPTQVFTPSKTNRTVKNYILNVKKVVKKLIDATERDIDVHFEYKHGNIVLEFTPAAYLHFAECIQAHLSNHDSVDVKIFERNDKMGKIVETSMSVLQKENSKFQHYRINMYNSTMRVEVNGKSHILFIEELKTIANLMSNKSTYQQLNSKIREACLKLVHHNVSHLSNPSTTDISITAGRTNVDICPKCNRKCLSKYIECSVGNHWIHFKCEKLTKEQINTSEQSPDVPLPPPNNYKSITSDGIGETSRVQQSQQNNTINCPPLTLAESILFEEVNIRSGNMTENSNPSVNSDNQTLSSNIEPVINNPSKSISKAIDIVAVEQLPVKQTKTVEARPNLKEKELRQKELILKKWEKELKQQNATNSQNSSENAKLQAYIMKLEGKIKELENSNRILRIKVAGNVDSTPTNVVNNDIPNPDLLQHHTEHIVGGFPMHLETQHLQSKIQSMENINSLNRRVSDLEYNSLKQRLDALELSKNWPSPQGNNLYHGYQNHISGPHVNGYQNHIPNPHVNGYHNHIPGLQVNGYQNQIPDLNGNGYQNHIPGPLGNGFQNHTPSSNVNSYYNKIPNPQVNGYQNLKPNMHMRNIQPMPNVPSTHQDICL
ncbi:unnamed protein product [Mytilus coruscus]|uniref:Uncharacterized protein n=1 Tax=Mytilus coruscus TaxID=42192 RepID=A0A6J8CT43_MYTCO|nr:unnamed protein product [Mytilus coruscus]